MMFCLARGAAEGPKAGISAALGIATGSFVHSLAAGLGLAVILSANPVAFEILRWSGVAYLLFLAYSSIRQPFVPLQAAIGNRSGLLKIWRDGTIVCLFNPKVALFILALVPQFVDTTRGSVVIQFLIFGAILNVGGTVINALVGYFSGSIGRILARKQVLGKWLQRISSAIFVGLAFRLALDRR